MERTKYKELLKWKADINRKPLVLEGARQVGKTFLVKQFGKKEYKNFVYLNFEQSKDLQLLFKGNLIPKEIINKIALFIGKKIVSNNTLLFFDEIQVVPDAITSLKYFYEYAPEFHIISAGSLLGVQVGKNVSFPVGKVNFLKLNPFSFSEYLLAFGEELLLEELLQKTKANAFSELIHNKLNKLLKEYLFLGGMPEVLQNYKNNKDIAQARKIQNEILEAYKRDFSKYTNKGQAVRTQAAWHSIPYQLAKENKKFQYATIQKRARAKFFEESIEWLKSAGLVHIVYNVSKPKLPLGGYANLQKFKIYLLDCGLLGAMLNISSAIIIQPNQLYTEFNGAFIENFVAMQFVANGEKESFYWTSTSDAEVDFVLQKENDIYPIEVKSGLSKNLKSIRSYQEKFKPKKIIRFSPRNYMQDNDFINIPLYGLMSFWDILLDE